MSFTLMRYFGRQFIFGTLMVSAIVMAIIFMVDAVEMLRQHAAKDQIGPILAIGLSLMKVPNIFEQTFALTFLFGAMWTFTRLTRSNELVVARASGVSVWQFLAPAVTIALVLGVAGVLVFNVASASLYARFKVIERTLLKGEHSTLNIGRNGLWLREVRDGDHRVVNALDVGDLSQSESIELYDIIALEFDGGDRFARRIDAVSATLTETTWDFREAWVAGTDGQARYVETLRLPTALSPRRIQESFARPETLNIWELTDFIRTARAAGFAVNRHRFHWHTLVSTPFLLTAMVFVAATFSLRLSRMGGVVQLIVAGIASAFGLFFMSDVTGALGQSGVLPPSLAAWAPTAVSALVGMTMLLHQEDG